MLVIKQKYQFGALKEGLIISLIDISSILYNKNWFLINKNSNACLFYVA
jgi:hypothetical protein